MQLPRTTTSVIISMHHTAADCSQSHNRNIDFSESDLELLFLKCHVSTPASVSAHELIVYYHKSTVTQLSLLLHTSLACQSLPPLTKGLASQTNFTLAEQSVAMIGFLCSLVRRIFPLSLVSFSRERSHLPIQKCNHIISIQSLILKFLVHTR